MYCPNCGTKLENGTICPVCSCNAAYADEKVKQWDAYIEEQSKPTITAANNKIPLKMEVLLPAIIVYTMFMGWLIFGVAGKDMTDDPVENFKITLEKNEFTVETEDYYTYFDENSESTLFFDFKKNAFGIKNDDISETYFYDEDSFEFKGKNTGYSITANYTFEDMNYTCETNPSTYSRTYCPRYRDSVIKEARDVKESFDSLLKRLAVKREDLVGETNE